MDSAIEIASTVAPSDSASQAPKPRSNTAPPKSGGPRKGSAKPGVDTNAPLGSVQVQAAGQSKTGKKTQPVSTTIPLTGWGEIDLYPFRRDIEPTFTVDARPYADLVDVCYTSLQSRFSSGGKHIPLGLFRYYCFTMWWARALWLHKSNARTLTTDEKNALNVLLAGEEYQLPSYVAQYLANMGNFQQGGEQYYFRLPDVHLGSTETDSLVKKGWFETDDPANRATSSTWWLYAQFPSPGAYVSYTCNEANDALPDPETSLTLDHIEPKIEGYLSYPTSNIIGWDTVPHMSHHSSWRATYANLGWSADSVPPDALTNFFVSTSTLKWVSERLSTLKDYKLHSSKQIFLSVQGSTLQSQYLQTEEPSTQFDQRPPVANVADNVLNASRFSELAVSSRFAMDSKSLAPSFCFGYRIKRSKVFKSFGKDKTPTYEKRSNYQPWLFTNKETTAYHDPPLTWFTAMDMPFEFGSQSFINVPRFSTHQLSRSVGLDAALVLSETR